MNPKQNRRRRFWIEVSNGAWTWGEKPIGWPWEGKRNLKAPASGPYIRMLQPLQPGDILLTYFSSKNAVSKELASSIVGVSKIGSSYRKEGKVLLIDTVDDTPLVTPIRFSEFKGLEGSSTYLKWVVKKSLQRYIFEIIESDFVALIDIHPENKPIAEKFLRAAETTVGDEIKS